jgi:hypothetical protein
MTALVPAPTPAELFAQRAAILQELAYFARLIFGRSAIIGGGAVRDVVTGVAWKDIDIFVEAELSGGMKTTFTDNCEAFAKYLRGTCEFVSGSPEYGDILDLCNVTTPQYPPIQVVALDDDPLEDLQSYDFALSQMAYKAYVGIVMTPLAANDWHGRTITYLGAASVLRTPDAGEVRSCKRLERLRAKYFGWRFVNCEALDYHNANGLGIIA